MHSLAKSFHPLMATALQAKHVAEILERGDSRRVTGILIIITRGRLFLLLLLWQLRPTRCNRVHARVNRHTPHTAMSDITTAGGAFTALTQDRYLLCGLLVPCIEHGARHTEYSVQHSRRRLDLMLHTTRIHLLSTDITRQQAAAMRCENAITRQKNNRFTRN